MIELKPAINEVKLTLKSISSPINLGTVVEPVSGGSVSTDVRQAIYTLLENAAYATTGLEDEIAIVQAWAQEVTALSISPTSLEISNTPQVITATVVPSGSLVTWTSSDESVATVVGGIVTGVRNGSCVITATAGGRSANCAVTVSGMTGLTSISAVYTPTKARAVLSSDSLDTLKQNLVVTATYADSSTETIPADEYYLSGTLTTGTSSVTVIYGGKTTTFEVTVIGSLPVEYKRAQYIHSDDMTGQYNGAYIDTGKKFGSSVSTARYLVGIQGGSISSSWTDSMLAISVRQTGGGSGNNHGFTAGLSAGSSDPRLFYSFGGATASWTPSDTSEFTTYHDMVATRTPSSVTLQVDDNEAVTVEGTIRAIGNGYNISLFAAKNNTVAGSTYMYKGKLYYAIVEQDGTEIFHGIPCVRISDNKVGIYDIVNNSFRTATSSGSQGSADIIKAGADY